MRNTGVFGISAFRATSRLLHTGIGTPLVECSLKVFIYTTTLEVRTSDNSSAPLRGRFCKHPVFSQRLIRENSPAGHAEHDLFLHLFLCLKA